MLVESFLIDKIFSSDETEGFEDKPSSAKKFFLFVLEVFIMSVAGYLAWNCYKNNGLVLRIIYTILALIFSGIYILFYIIYHGPILNQMCN